MSSSLTRAFLPARTSPLCLSSPLLTPCQASRVPLFLRIVVLQGRGGRYFSYRTTRRTVSARSFVEIDYRERGDPFRSFLRWGSNDCLVEVTNRADGILCQPRRSLTLEASYRKPFSSMKSRSVVVTTISGCKMK